MGKSNIKKNNTTKRPVRDHNQAQLGSYFSTKADQQSVADDDDTNVDVASKYRRVSESQTELKSEFATLRAQLEQLPIELPVAQQLYEQLEKLHFKIEQ